VRGACAGSRRAAADRLAAAGSGGSLVLINFHYFPSFPYEVNASEVFVREKKS